MTEYIVRMPPDMPYEIRAELDAWYVESEPIVRCRDCANFRATDETCHSWQWHNWDAAIEVESNGFCAWGERRAE